MINRASKTREEIFGAIRAFTAATVGEADQATDAIIRIVNNAAPSPSPAPGVVELLERFVRVFKTGYSRDAFARRDYDDIAVDAMAALASLSQPAKGERP